MSRLQHPISEGKHAFSYASHAFSEADHAFKNASNRLATVYKVDVEFLAMSYATADYMQFQMMIQDEANTAWPYE